MPKSSFFFKAYYIYLNFQIQELKRYHERMSLFLADERIRIEGEWNDLKNETMDGHSRDMIEEELIDELKMSEVFPQYFRVSSLISVYSFIEFQMRQICKRYTDIRSTTYSINDLAGDEFQKTKAFLTKSAFVNFSYLSEEWAYLLAIRTVRNRFVHHQGEVASYGRDYDAIYEIVKKNKQYLDLNRIGSVDDFDGERYQIVISSDDFSLRLLSVADAFFRKILLEQLR